MTRSENCTASALCVLTISRAAASALTHDRKRCSECYVNIICKMDLTKLSDRASGRTSSSRIILLELVWLHMAGYAAKVHPLGTDRRMLRDMRRRQSVHPSKSRQGASSFIAQTCLSKAGPPSLAERRTPSQPRKRPRQDPACSSCGRSILSQASESDRGEA